MCSFSTETQFESPAGMSVDSVIGEPSANIALSQNEDIAIIRLHGGVDIAMAAELKAALLKAAGSGCGICIQLTDAAALDVTAFQLLWAANQEAKRAGVSFKISGHLSESIGKAFAELGLHWHLLRHDEE